MDNPAEPIEQEIESTAEDFNEATEADQEAISDGEAQSDATEGEQEALSEEVYYDIDGEEVSLEDVRKWKSGSMMQSDYTKKTQEVAEERKAVQTERKQLSDGLETLQAIESDIETLILGEQSDLSELRETDTAEYLRLKEEAEARKGKLSELKGKYAELKNQQLSQAATKLHESLGWDDQAKKQSDIKTLTEYSKEAGITDAEFSAVTSPAIMAGLLEAAKYRKLMAEKPSVTKKVVKTPKAVKPKVTQERKVLSLAERMYGTN